MKVTFNLSDPKESVEVAELIISKYSDQIQGFTGAEKPKATPKKAAKKQSPKVSEPPPLSDADAPREVVTEAPLMTQPPVAGVPEDDDVPMAATDYTLADIQTMAKNHLVSLSDDANAVAAARSGILEILSKDFGVTSSAALESNQLNDAYIAIYSWIKQN